MAAMAPGVSILSCRELGMPIVPTLSALSIMPVGSGRGFQAPQIPPWLIDVGRTAAELILERVQRGGAAERAGGSRGQPFDPNPIPIGPGSYQEIPAPGPNGSCPPSGEKLCGFHWNKQGYWTAGGYVEKGTRMVKNRRMNPLNPRALRRAMRREKGFVRFASSMGMRWPEATRRRSLAPKKKTR